MKNQLQTNIISDINPSLESLISNNQTSITNDVFDKNKINLSDFKKLNIDKFKEGLLYYSSSPETLKNY